MDIRLGITLFVLSLVGLVRITPPQPTHAATTWYVATDASDTNDCLSPSTPCATINGAIGKALSGDTIYVATGTYTSTADSEVILVDKDATLLGGWDAGFVTQSGMSTVDGQGSRRGMTISDRVTASVERFTFQNGYSRLSGGGVSNRGTLTMTATLVSGNTAGDPCCTGGYGGGGIENSHLATLTLNSSTVSGNQILGGFSGSAIRNTGRLTVNNSTISGNSGAESIYNFVGSVKLNSSTISNNFSGIKNLAGSVTFRNSIIAANRLTDCYNDRDYSGTVTGLGYNLVQSNYNCTLTTSDLSSDPKLGPLQNNGGLTPTHALLAGSPAINAGNPAGCTDDLDNPLLYDQRGAYRMGRCDIGAYEAGLTVTKQARGSTYPGGSVTYMVTLQNAARNADLTSVFVTDTLPLGLAYVTGTLTTNNGSGRVAQNTIHWNGTVFSNTETLITFGAAISNTMPWGIWITNTTVSSWEGMAVASEASFDTFAHVYLPLVSRNYCADFFDDFSNPDSGWPVGEDDYVRAEYLDGEYRILSKQGGYLYLFRAPTCDRQNYVLETDARWVGSPGNSYGLIFGLTSDFNQYYLFDMNTEAQMYRLYRRSPGGFTPIVLPTASSAIHGGTASNHIKVTRNDNFITLEVNGSVLATWSDSTITGLTGVGLVSSSSSDVPTSDARFDNFRVGGLASRGTATDQLGSMVAAEATDLRVTTSRIRLPDYLAQWRYTR